MSPYIVKPFYQCGNHEGTYVAEIHVKADSEDMARVKAMAKFRREFLGGDMYSMLKVARAHEAGKDFEFKWKSEGYFCTVWFGEVEHGSDNGPV